jgi:hypothetical protein
VQSALKAANIGLGRAVTCQEVLSQMVPQDREQLRRDYAKTPSSMVAAFVGHDIGAGLARKCGSVGGRSYYVHVGAIPFEREMLPPSPTAQGRVLVMLRKAVEHFGRAVRGEDILAVVDPADVDGFTLKTLNRVLCSLHTVGKVRVGGAVRGHRGRHLYLPLGQDVSKLSGEVPTTRRDAIVSIVRSLWASRASAVAGSGHDPAPLSTREVWRAFRVDFPGVGQRYLSVSLKDLADRADGIRLVRAGGRARDRYWVPVEVQLAALELKTCFSTDGARATEAVRRAETRLGRPVTADEAEEEVNADATLAPVGVRSFTHVLHTEASRKRRRTRRSYNAGRVGKQAFFATAEAGTSKAIVDFHRLEWSWRGTCRRSAPDRISECILPWVAVGRARLLSAEVATATACIEQATRAFGARAHDTSGQIKRDCDEFRRLAARALEDHTAVADAVPTVVNETVPLMTAAELWGRIGHIYPSDQSSQKLSGRMGKFVRRVVPALGTGASRSLMYDRTESLVYAAMHWGGPTAALHASTCDAEMGALRDPRYLAPALRAIGYEQRLVAVSCAAFLADGQLLQILKELAVGDADPGVREAATWACGFAGGADAREWAKVIAGRRHPPPPPWASSVAVGGDWLTA